MENRESEVIMAVTEKMKSVAGDLELFPGWRSRLSSLTPIGYDYGKGNEPRRYYTDGAGRYYYRRVTESEMHRNK